MSALSVPGLEKTPDFYLRNGFFWVEMGRFLTVFALEVQPMATFIRWRIAKDGATALVASAPLDRLITLNDVETVFVLVNPFGAARGAWLF